MSRYAKRSGATTLEPFAPEQPLRRFKPDFYNPPKELPSRNPKFGGARVPRTFGAKVPSKPVFLPNLGGFGRYAGAASLAFWGLDVADGFMPGKSKVPLYRPPPNWIECKYPCYKTPQYWAQTGGKYEIRGNNTYWCSPTNYCIGGQGISGTKYLVGDPIAYEADANPGTNFGWYFPYRVGGGSVFRQQHHRSFTVVGEPGAPPYVWHPIPFAWREVSDPNIEKHSDPASPDPAADFHGPPDNVSPPRVPRAPRSRNPRKRTRERKQKGPIQTVLRIADFLSESAELVGAFYDALPKKTKDKWGCDKLKRGLLDSAGQYGIDGADCKLQALWHNWHKVDIDKGIKNAIANEIQDRILGELQRRVPVNTGRTTDDAMKEINEWIGAFNEWLGL